MMPLVLATAVALPAAPPSIAPLPILAERSARRAAPRSGRGERRGPPATPSIPVAPPASPAAAPDYADGAAWLCRPGRDDACAGNLDWTVVRSDGRTRPERFRRAKSPAFDCFYVYPTVSLDPSPNSDLTPGPEERAVVTAQAARFGSECRVFAPVYRQVTLAALRAAMAGRPTAADRAMALADVTAAWQDYLARDNGGRGVVLVGHSQGAGLLKELMAHTIEPSAARRNIVSAMLIGTNVGATELRSPPCRADRQYGCVVSYVSFAADGPPPPPGGRFGRAADGGPALCTNPAALAGGRATTDAVFAAAGPGASGAPQADWGRGVTISTPFVRVPGLISAECVRRDGAGYLAVGVNADPADARTDTVSGAVVANGRALPEWGLHLIDVPVAMGDLVRLAGTQAAAWRGAPTPRGRR